MKDAVNGTIIDESQVETRPEKVPSSCLDENVCIDSCRKYFSHDAWAVISNLVDTISKNPVYYCGRCSCPIADDKHQSIACDCCLTWFHFTCLSMTTPPKARVWIVEAAMICNITKGYSNNVIITLDNNNVYSY